MAISKTQPMREAEIELVELANQLESDIGTANTAIETLSQDLATEIENRENLGTTLSRQLELETSARESADSLIDARLVLVENDMEHFPVLEWGNDSESLPANSSVSGAFLFDNEKQGIPLIIAGLETIDEDASNTGTFLEIYNVTVTGFNYKIVNPDMNNAVSIGINWIAIGG